MRARLIFCTILAFGALLTAGVGAGFAQTGLDDSSNAGTQQYGQSIPAPPPSAQDVLGEVGTVDESEPAPVQQTAAQATPAPQVASAPESEGELPFTGFAVVTTLLLGLALLSAGLVMRRKTAKGTE